MCWTRFERAGVGRTLSIRTSTRYMYAVKGLPFGLTHIVVVVRIASRKFVLTAYGIERKGGR
jgi:hypothetical protein